jgi:hypothetical protein
MKTTRRTSIFWPGVLILALVVLGFWYFQRNVFSKDVLRLEIIGPETVEAGQKVDYVLKYKNNGKILLTEPKLTFECPANSLLAESEKLRTEKELADIYPGQEQTMSFSCRLFGREQELKTSRAWLEFRPKNLKAKYEVETSQTGLIKFSPLTFEFDLSSRLEAEKEFGFSLNYFSNIDYPLSGLRLKIDYPSGFEFLESQPKALGSNEWEIPVLNKAEGGRVRISGRLRGEIGQQKTFKATLALWPAGQLDPISLKEVSRAAEIVKPNLYLSQLVNGQTDYAARPGETLRYEIFFKNIGSSPFENLFLVVSLDGELFDLESLRAENAGYSPGSNSLLWDWKKNSQLRFLDENEEGKVEFWVGLKNAAAGNLKNPFLKNTVSLAPTRQEFFVRVNSPIALEQKVFFQDSHFNSDSGNGGGWPPEVGQNTSFTLAWKLKNYFNDLKNVKVKAVLPPEVSLTGRFLPKEARFVFDSSSKEIIWDWGDLAANQESQEFFLQLVLSPSGGQRRQLADLLKQVQVFADDTWTGETISQNFPSLNTGSLGDPNFNPSQGIVQ